MKELSSPTKYSPFTARILKLVGVILILSFLLDFVLLWFPSGARDRQWQLALATSMIDRGIVPMLGLALILAGYWIDDIASNFQTSSKRWLDLKLWALVFSSLLGLLFLLIVPLHINNAIQAKTETIQQITQKALQAETQLQSQLSQVQTQLGDERFRADLEQQRSQLKNQINELLKNEQSFKQAIQSNQMPEEQKKLLQQFKANPQALDQYVAQQTDPQAFSKQKLSQIRAQKEQLQQQAIAEAWRSGLRIGISSLLFAIGYIFIGWTGLKSAPRSLNLH